MSLQFALELARSAGEIIKEGYFKQKVISQKCSIADLVTETDTKVENFVQKKISEQFPTHEFIGEESVSSGAKISFTDSPTWIIDPVDGTSNFVHRFPFCCISIAYAEKKKVALAVVYNPILDEMYHAELGKGAFLNGAKLSVSDAQNLSSSILCSEWGSQRDATMDTKVRNMHKAVLASRGIRSIGSAALSCCMVARGSVESYFEYGIHCWDVAAGELIVREAGGVSASPDGSPFDLMSRSVLVSCCRQVLDETSACIERIPFDRE
uniref:Inositol-1-monophosphatase n=2 Tax=Macrostomum lignano TaxID=282301 RepID=A0A1I8HPM6_9PLAT